MTIGSDLNDVDVTLTQSDLNVNNNSKVKIKLLPLSKIRLDENNVRKSYDQEHIEALASSIANHGLLEEISVREDADEKGSYIINYGHYRYLAHKHLGEQYIGAKIDNLNDSIEIKLTENIVRKEMSLLEISEALKHALAEGKKRDPKYNHEQLASLVSKSKTWVTRRISLCDTDPYIYELLSTHKINDAETANSLNALIVNHRDIVESRVAQIDGAISSKLVRAWTIELNNPKKEDDQKKLETPEAVEVTEVKVSDNLNLLQDQGEIESLNTSDKSAEEFSTVTKKEAKEILKSSKSGDFNELNQAYYQGILDSYSTILNYAVGDDANVSHVAKGILRSFNDEKSANLFEWNQLITMPFFANEITSIIQSMVMLQKFVKSSELKNDQMDLILKQQNLI